MKNDLPITNEEWEKLKNTPFQVSDFLEALNCSIRFDILPETPIFPKRSTRTYKNSYFRRDLILFQACPFSFNQPRYLPLHYSGNP